MVRPPFAKQKESLPHLSTTFFGSVSHSFGGFTVASGKHFSRIVPLLAQLTSLAAAPRIPRCHLPISLSCDPTHGPERTLQPGCYREGLIPHVAKMRIVESGIATTIWQHGLQARSVQRSAEQKSPREQRRWQQRAESFLCLILRERFQYLSVRSPDH